MRRIVADTGPIVALLNKRDQYHDWAVRTFEGLEPPLHTCEPVLAEVAWLVRKLPAGTTAVIDLIIRGVLRVDFRVDAELLALRTLVNKYASVPMSLADACLVRMTELDPKSEVVTLDADFRLYRRSGRLAIRLITPHVA
jgi:predicted nucleic acid-binding protein